MALASFTSVSIVGLARFFMDRDGTDSGLTDTQLYALLNSRYQVIRRKIAEIAPDLYTARKDFTISSGSTYALSGISPDDFGKILKLERLVGSDYIPMYPAPLLSAESTPGYRLRGANIDIFPSTDAIASYRLTYLTKPSVAIDDSADTLSLPEGAEMVLALELAAMCRPRFDDDPTGDIRAAQAAWAELVEGLVDQYAASPQQIAQVY